MKRSIFRSFTAAAALLIAALAYAQSADKNTAGPTANQLQLKLSEPAEGSTITGNSVRVVVVYNTRAFGQGQGTRFGEPNFPHPIFDVFLDNDLKASLKGGESNVANIENVPYGDHKVVVMAKNISGEVIDRKEVNFKSIEAPAPGMAMEGAPAAPPPPPPAPAPAITERTETTTIETAPPPPPRAPADELPATASHHPRVALMGLALVLAGLVLTRKAR